MTPEQIIQIQELYYKISSMQGFIEFSLNALKAIQETENDQNVRLRSWRLNFTNDLDDWTIDMRHDFVRRKQKEILEFIKNLLNEEIAQTQKEIEELKNDI